MVQDGEIDYYGKTVCIFFLDINFLEARRLVYCLSLRLNEANIKTDIKGTVYPRVGTTEENTGLYHDWTNFIYREKKFYKDYWNIAAASGSGITRDHIKNWYPKLKRELEKGNQSTLAKSASEYVNEVFRRYNIDQEGEEGSQHGYLVSRILEGQAFKGAADGSTRSLRGINLSTCGICSIVDFTFS